jgi:hypothetical protein
MRSANQEYLSKIIFFGERSLHRAVRKYVAHYNSSGIIKESRTSCCSRGSRIHAGRDLCDVANGSAGACAITIREPLEGAAGDVPAA